jgi:MFS family permease
MQLLVPEILTETRGLSVPLSATGMTLGLLLWLFGWRGHRFWIVLVATVAAGIFGLYSGPAYGTKPLVAGILLAVAAGALALALVRVVAFICSGVAFWTLVHVLVPAWNEPLVCFLVGGLVGLVLFRLWTMALTSFAGSLLLLYFGLSLANSFGKLDAVAFGQTQTLLLNWACGFFTLLGLIVQVLLERRWRRAQPEPDPSAQVQPAPLPMKDKDKDKDKNKEKEKPWWDRAWRGYRRAG